MTIRLSSIFPYHHIKNVALFYVLSSVYNMWFVAGVWIFIWGRFMTNTQIGLSDALTFAAGFLLELPSGVIADFIGRRRAILLGNTLLTVGNFFLGFSSSFFGVTLWYLVWTVGYAFQSGATEALAYDSLKESGEEAGWSKVIATSSIIGRTSSLIATSIGGLLFTVWFRLPYVVFALSGIIGIIAAFLLKEIPVKFDKKKLFQISSYTNQIRDGVSILKRADIFPVSLISLCVLSTAFIYNWGILRPLIGQRFGFTALTLPLLLSTASVVVIAATLVLIRLKKSFNTLKLLFFSSLVYSLIFISMSFPNGWLLGGLIMILLPVFSTFVDQLFSQYINLHTKAEHRATTLSAVALFTRGPYVLLAVITGVIADGRLLPQFVTLLGLTSLLVFIISLWLLNKQHS